jgi:hypothetical protein
VNHCPRISFLPPAKSSTPHCSCCTHVNVAFVAVFSPARAVSVHLKVCQQMQQQQHQYTDMCTAFCPAGPAVTACSTA